MRAKDKSLEKKYYSRDVAWEQEKRKTENSVHVSLLRTRLKLEDAVRKVDNRSEWRTTIHGVAYPRSEDGQRQGKTRQGAT